jgi:hypothetical protein
MQWPTEGGIIIGGDGYAYVPYSYNEWAYPIQFNHLLLLRIDSSGAYETIRIFAWTSVINFDGPMLSTVNMITNADQGILLSWDTWSDWWNREPHMAITTGGTASLINSPAAGQFHYVAPALQLQDGSFVGTASVEDTWDPRYMLAFDATGNLLWSVAGNYQPQIATADGGIIATTDDGSAVTFDQNGNATGQLAIPGNGLPNWDAQIYTAGASGVESVAFWAELGASFATLPGGNPSGNGTYVPNFGLAESHPIWKKFRQAVVGEDADCKLGADTDKIPLAGDARNQYDTLRKNELDLLNSLTIASPCEQFFLENTQLTRYFPWIVSAVANQVPWDADLSHLSKYAAKVWNQKDQADVRFWPTYQTIPVCREFYDNHSWNGVTALAQATPAPGATDVYIFPKQKAWKLLTPATILHESLHNLTGLDDGDLYRLLSGAGLEGKRSGAITVLLRDKGCGQ